MIRVPAPLSKGGSDPSRPLVLYVEDEDDNWVITELRLKAKYQMLRAADDQEACSLVRSHGDSLYAILMDIQLKGSKLDGIQLCRLFKGQLKDADVPTYAQGCKTEAPIFFVTAYGNRFTELELIEAGGMALLTKPVDFVRLNLALAGAHARTAVAAFNK